MSLFIADVFVKLYYRDQRLFFMLSRLPGPEVGVETRGRRPIAA